MCCVWEVNCQNSSGKQNREMTGHVVDIEELFSDTSPLGTMMGAGSGETAR